MTYLFLFFKKNNFGTPRRKFAIIFNKLFGFLKNVKYNPKYVQIYFENLFVWGII